MGADLYLMSLHDPQQKKWSPRFEAAVAERDRQKPGTPAHERAQKRVMQCYDRMLAKGYFRDPYNDLDVLWKFDLSWWGDVIPMLDDAGCLPVAEAKRLLQMLAEHDGDFRDNLAGLSAREARYFRRQAQELKAFLTTATLRAEAIRCSL